MSAIPRSIRRCKHGSKSDCPSCNGERIDAALSRFEALASIDPREALIVAVAYGEAWQNYRRGSPIRRALELGWDGMGWDGMGIPRPSIEARH